MCRPLPVFFPTPSICSVAFTPCAPPFAGCGPVCPVVKPAGYGRETQGAVSYASARAPPPGHAPSRDPRQPDPSRCGSAPGQTASAAAGGRLDVAATSNAAERFLGAFERFYRAKGGQNLASAQKHVALFMLGYVFETFRRRPVPNDKADALCKWRAMRSARCRCFMCSIGPTPHDCAMLSRRDMIWRRERPHPRPSCLLSRFLRAAWGGVCL